MKVFLSTPMKGKSEEEIAEYRQKQIELAKVFSREEEIEIIFTKFEMDFDYSAVQNRVRFLAESIKKLSEADLVVFPSTKEIKRNNGCAVEYEVAKRYGIPMILMPFDIEEEK